MNMQEDFSCLDTALYLSNCNAHYPVSDEYEINYPQKKGQWWLDWNDHIVGGQRIHVITYLGSCYKLKRENRDSMRHVWSKRGFKNAAGLIWLLEALGADQDLIKKAYNAGSELGRLGMTQPKQSCEIKNAVTWEKHMRQLLSDKKIKAPQ